MAKKNSDLICMYVKLKSPQLEKYFTFDGIRSDGWSWEAECRRQGKRYIKCIIINSNGFKATRSGACRSVKAVAKQLGFNVQFIN